MKVYMQYLDLPETQDPAEINSREQMLQWAVSEMVEQIYKKISEEYQKKDLEITLWIKTEEGEEL